MVDVYKKSYVEVLEILKYMPKEDFEKIPKEKIEFYESNRDKSYKYVYNIDSPKTSKITNAILVSLYRNYIANDEQKEQINKILKLNEEKSEKEKEQKYSVDRIFEDRNNQEKNLNKQMIVKKENTFSKIFEKIKRIFKKCS